MGWSILFFATPSQATECVEIDESLYVKQNAIIETTVGVYSLWHRHGDQSGELILVNPDGCVDSTLPNFIRVVSRVLGFEKVVLP